MGGLPELADRDGAAVPPGDPAALAAAMRVVWGRRNDRDFGRSAWESAGERFSLEGQIGELLALYTRLLGARR